MKSQNPKRTLSALLLRQHHMLPVLMRGFCWIQAFFGNLKMAEVPVFSSLVLVQTPFLAYCLQWHKQCNLADARADTVPIACSLSAFKHSWL